MTLEMNTMARATTAGQCQICGGSGDECCQWAGMTDAELRQMIRYEAQVEGTPMEVIMAQEEWRAQQDAEEDARTQEREAQPHPLARRWW